MPIALELIEQSMRQPDDAMLEGVAYVDGAYLPANEASVPLLDWGFTRSDAFQETVSFWGGYFFRLDDHIERFYRSAERLRMTPPTEEELRSVLHELVGRGGYSSAYIQFLMTRGVPPVGDRDVRNCVNRFRAYAIPYVWIARPQIQERGMRLHLSDRRRIPPVSVDPRVKHYHWLDFQLGLLEAYDAGCETVLLQDVEGNLAEGPGFNVFIVEDGKLFTPEAINVLDGMTRRTIIELAASLQIPVAETEIPPDRLASCDEVFITTTAGGVIPIASVDGMEIGDGTPGPLSSRLHESYWTKRADGWLGTALQSGGTPPGADQE
ncbi:MAG: aminotransferase class IV [Pseudomonadota bacterium]